MPMSSSWFCLHSSENETDLTHAILSLDNRGLAYGDGFFTTMGVIDGQILWLDYHHQRLISHQKALQLDVDSHSLITALTTHAQRLQQGILKLIVVRAAQAVRGYGYTSSASGSACDVWLKSSDMVVATDKQLCLPDGRLIPIQPASTAICLSAQIACLPPPLAGLKSLNRLDTVLASAELQRIKSHLLPSDSSHTPAQSSIEEGLLRDMNG
ncbi:MAG: aminotransferase class IV, partial [Psychrobacter alimentarius]